MRCLFYAMGGGRGHQTRTQRIFAAMKHRQPNLTALALVPEDRIQTEQPGLTLSISPTREPNALALWIQQELKRFRPDLVVVDTFPRGVLGELKELELQVPKALVTRWVEPRYYRVPGVWEALNRFDQVFWTEPKSDPTFPGVQTDPVLPTSPSCDRETSRQTLGASERPLVLVFGWGDLSEQMRQQTRFTTLSVRHNWDLRFLSAELRTHMHEVWRLLSGADLIISACGYNACYEIAQHSVPVAWVPQQRKVDDQAVRATGVFPHTTLQPFLIRPEGPSENDLLSLLKAPRVPTSVLPPKGAEQLAERLLSMVAPACLAL